MFIYTTIRNFKQPTFDNHSKHKSTKSSPPTMYEKCTHTFEALQKDISLSVVPPRNTYLRYGHIFVAGHYKYMITSSKCVLVRFKLD